MLASDGTVVFGDGRSRGSMLTAGLCRRHGKPCLMVPLDSDPVDAASRLRPSFCALAVALAVAGERAFKRADTAVLRQ